jgi:hypothetical protein
MADSKSALKVPARMPKKLAKRITGNVEQYALTPRAKPTT